MARQELLESSPASVEEFPKISKPEDQMSITVVGEKSAARDIKYAGFKWTNQNWMLQGEGQTVDSVVNGLLCAGDGSKMAGMSGSFVLDTLL